jgi:8-oxo-dGTP diphosphatase
MPPSEQGLPLSLNRYRLIPRVLCFVTLGGEVLLIKGAPTKKIWANKYNGLGGHVERGETVQAAAAREIQEEAGLEARDLRLRGVITIDTGEAAGIIMFVFTATAPTRAAHPSGEGALEWVPLARVRELPCVEDVPVLLEKLAHASPTASPLSGRYWYDDEGRLQMAWTG